MSFPDGNAPPPAAAPHPEVTARPGCGGWRRRRATQYLLACALRERIAPRDDCADGGAIAPTGGADREGDDGKGDDGQGGRHRGRR